MSVFSSSVKSSIIDPVFTSNTRCEFRLANRGESYMPTLRVGNLGLTTSGNDNAYHYGMGALSVISRIQLMDGNEPLDSLRNVGNWLTFKNSLKTNSQNDNVFKRLAGGHLGWETGATGELLSNNNKVIRQEGNIDETLGTLDLREVFPILNSISHLSTKLFKNLRVVIEYNTQQIDLINGLVGGDAFTKQIPILIVDEIIDDALAASLDKQLVTAQWQSIEHDQVSVPAVAGISAAGDIADSTIQNINLRVNGFQNKGLGRLMVSKVYQDKVNYIYQPAGGNDIVKGLAQYGSKALHKEEFNIRVNGRNVLAGRGVDSPASMAMLTADTWGEVNCCPFTFVESVGLDCKYDLTDSNLTPTGRPPLNWTGVNETAPRILSAGGDLAADGATWTTAPTSEQGVMIGNSSWVGVGIHDRVSDMQIQLTRTGNPTSVRTAGTQATDQPISSAGNYQALDLHIFAEVNKSLQVMGSEYKVLYA